jgi:YHS domain-containing protein
MTTRRPQRKPPARRRRMPFANLALAAAICLSVWAGIQTPSASTTDRLVVNPASGLAISGFDPVAYFAQHDAVLGRPELELTQNGAVWRFHNEGNRAAFAEHPEVYTPQFGGFDPVAIDREASVPGHPEIWAVAGERLYLFYNDRARAAFLDNPGRFVESAGRKWPDVARTIAR